MSIILYTFFTVPVRLAFDSSMDDGECKRNIVDQVPPRVLISLGSLDSGCVLSAMTFSCSIFFDLHARSHIYVQDFMWFVDVLIDLIFLCDVFINFRTAYVIPAGM